MPAKFYLSFGLQGMPIKLSPTAAYGWLAAAHYLIIHVDLYLHLTFELVDYNYHTPGYACYLAAHNGSTK